MKKRFTAQIGLYIGPDLAQKVKDKCQGEDRKISEIVRSLLRLWVNGKIEI